MTTHPLYTDAPSAYDGFGTTSVPTAYKTSRGPLRLVTIKAEHMDWQRARYLSGCYEANEDVGFLVRIGIATEAGP